MHDDNQRFECGNQCWKMPLGKIMVNFASCGLTAKLAAGDAFMQWSSKILSSAHFMADSEGLYGPFCFTWCGKWQKPRQFSEIKPGRKCVSMNNAKWIAFNEDSYCLAAFSFLPLCKKNKGNGMVSNALLHFCLYTCSKSFLMKCNNRMLSCVQIPRKKIGRISTPY